MDKIKANNNFKSTYYSLNKKEMNKMKKYYSLNENEMNKKENNNLKPTHYFSDSDSLFRSNYFSYSDSGYNSDTIKSKNNGMPKFIKDLIQIKKYIKNDDSTLREKDGTAMSKVASEYLQKSGSVKEAFDMYIKNKEEFKNK